MEVCKMPAFSMSRARRGGPFHPSRAPLVLAALLWLPFGAMIVKVLGL